jgi:dipeptidyl aminopeptidase/acylaminoacyl peptidase
LRRAWANSCLLIVLFLLFPSLIWSGSEKHTFTARDLWQIKRLSSLALSPDGEVAAVVVTHYDIEKDEGQGDIWMIRTDGSGVKRFTTGETTEESPCWNSDGDMLAFTARRGGENPQLCIIPDSGGEAKVITDMPMGVSSPKWVPGKDKILFVSKVIPGYGEDLESMRAELNERKEDKVSAKITENRLYRFWDHWYTDGTVPHLFLKDVANGELTDLNPGWDRLFNAYGGIEYDVSPDGDEIALTAIRNGPPYDSLTTDVILMPVNNPGHYRNITLENVANDFSPRYSPDGKYILYGRQKIVGFYGDRVRLIRYDRETGEKICISDGFDRSPSGWAVCEDDNMVYFHADDRGMESIFRVSVDGDEVEEVFRGGTNTGLDIIPSGRIVFLHQNNSQPDCVCTVRRSGGGFSRLTDFNGSILSRIEFGRFENEWFRGAGGDMVQMFVVYPAGFDASQKWPLLVLVHGGPHGTFGDEFHPRWNAQLMAAPGFVTAMVNFHGSSSFGQDFTDAITGAHGNKPFTDVMRAVDTLIARGFIDPDRMAVAGGSYGGYLASWIGTQTDRFACIINHAGVFDLCTQFGSDVTFGRARAYGATPWDGLERVIRWSPAHNMKNYSTPTLIIHGEKDFRVPVGNGLEIYGMLKAKGIPARLIYFPDENHWVQSPQNSIFWYREFHGWLERFIESGPGS